MFEGNSYLITAAQLAGLALATRWLLSPKETPAKKLHVDYGKEVSLPLPLKIIASLPDSIRVPLLIKASKPSPPKDSIDVLGTDEVDPYKKREIVPGKIWGVQYKCIVDPQLAKFMGMFLDGSKEAAAIANAPDHLKETLEADVKRKEEYDALSEEEKAKLGGDMIQEMYVIKLDDGGLLLYNPVRMHPQMIEWLKDRGEVEYIVSGSSAHTNHLPKTAETFPDAKIMCASVADAKCQAVGMRPADFLYDLSRNEEPSKKCVDRGTREDALDEFGGKIKLFHIRGDVMTDALFLLVHEHLFAIDLIYTTSEQGKKDNEFETGTSLIHSVGRIFAYSLVTEKAKPLGYKIPLYRCIFMDPANPMASRMSLTPPNKDGSSCTQMAESIGAALKELHKPGVCVQVHDGHTGSMTLSDFSQIIGQTWGWLDEKKFGLH